EFYCLVWHNNAYWVF
nr:immunoglobulin light chain junction region [Macaca mulatta]